jgi:glutaredoxin
MTVSRKKVIVYTAGWCPWCHKAMEFLTGSKVKFEIRDVDNPVFAQEAMEKSGQGGIPVIIVGKDVVIGFDDVKLKSLLNIK